MCSANTAIYQAWASHFSNMSSLIKLSSISVTENLNRIVNCYIKYFCTTKSFNYKYTDKININLNSNRSKICLKFNKEIV
jgi:hypothetical protein